MPIIKGEAPEGIQSVILALRMLECLAAEEGSIGVTELARRLGSTKSRIHRHLQTLISQGYVIRAPQSERYKVGFQLVTLGRQVAENTRITDIAVPQMRRLREALGHTCVYSQIEPDGVRVVHTLSGKSAIEIGVKAGSLLPFHNTAQGKLALAYLPDDVAIRILDQGLPATTPETITDPVTLKVEMEKIRHRGWATAANQGTIGLNALAVPIFDEAGDIAGSLAFVDFLQYIPAKPSPEQIAEISSSAQVISSALGYNI